MLDMMAKIKLEEEREEAIQSEGNPQSTPEATQQDRATTTNTMNLYNQSPTMTKRKFLKTQSDSQRITDAEGLDNTHNTKACLDN
jgi:hypothetical protein